MSILLRFILTLSGLFVVGLLAADRFHRANDNAIAELIEGQRAEHRRVLDTVINLQGTELSTWMASFSWWDEAVSFVAEPDAEWASENIDIMVGTTSGGDTVWITTPDLKAIHSADAEYRSRPLPFQSSAELDALLADNYEFSFFIFFDGELWEIHGAAIQDPNFWRNETPVVGYAFMGNRWDRDHLTSLGSLTETRLEIHPAATNHDASSDENPVFSELSFDHPIPGIDGKKLAVIRSTFSAPAIEKFDSKMHENLLWWAIIFVIILTLVGGILGFTIVQPLGRIIRSLDTRDPIHLSDLLVAKSDFGEIARLISSQFRRGRMLQDEIRRRSTIPDTSISDHRTNEAFRLRLASNLHDGPMQSLYAARLKLGAMQPAITRHGGASKEEIESIRNMLEECSKDLRNLLLDIEPEELRDQGLDSTLPRFEKHLQTLAKEAATFKVSPRSFEGCSRETQIHLLYLIRELVSNVGRHAHPRYITFEIERQPDELTLIVENDGVNTSRQPAPGNGLINVGQRVAGLGGDWTQELTSRKTWFVRITLPIPTKLDQPLALEDA